VAELEKALPKARIVFG